MIDLVIDGVLRGGIYATAAVGYVILYRSIKVINLAYGAMALLAAYLYWMLTPQLPPLLGFLAILPVMALLAVVADKAVVRPMLGEPVIQIIAATIGLGYLIKGALLLVLQLGYALPGYQQVPYETPLLPRGFVELGALRLDLNFLGAFLASIAAFLLLWVFYKKTSLGIAMRAMSNDRPSAVAFGVRPTEAITTSWILAGLLATISGVFYASIFGGPSGSVEYIGVKALPVIILGGLDSVGGALVGGVIVGLAEVLGKLFLDPYLGGGFGEVFPLLVMVAVLLVRPYGLFGTERIERV
ncbi:MAG: branched-chain amino acid ABC transporter permease [Pyrobaculum sp.]|jgi:branched-chain amino acid transport system permease protein|nr:branched-chain amino acid ABC transporter permease [Pyrobaculum sp.]